MLTLERLKIQQHEPPFNKEDVGPDPSRGQRKRIKEDLEASWMLLKKCTITVDDETLKLILITAGFHNVEEWIMEEAINCGYLSEKIEKTVELLKKPTDLPTKSDGYLLGLKELIIV